MRQRWFWIVEVECVLLIVPFISGCLLQQPERTNNTFVSSVTNTVVVDPTDVFITAAMRTKYAVRTEMAAVPTLTPTPPISPDSRLCHSADLTSGLGLNGAGGHIVLEVGITNHSNTPCFLPAWPVIQLLDREGKTVDIDYDFSIPNGSPSKVPPTEQASPGEPIRFGLRAGQSSGMALFWGNWCQPAIKGGVIIRLTLLDEAGGLDIPTDVEGGGHCDDPSTISTIDVYGFGY